MSDYICEKHNERYQDINMCSKCLEEMEIKIKQLEAENGRLKTAIVKAINQMQTPKFTSTSKYMFMVCMDIAKNILQKASEGKGAM